MFFSFQQVFQLREHPQLRSLKFTDPPLSDRVDRHGIDEVQFFASLPLRRNQIGLFQNLQMLAHRLTCHLDAFAQLTESLRVTSVQSIKQLTPTAIGQRAKNRSSFMRILCNRLVACQVNP